MRARGPGTYRDLKERLVYPSNGDHAKMLSIFAQKDRVAMGHVLKKELTYTRKWLG